MLKSVLDNFKTLFIFPHVLPDGDTLGASVALARYLESINKEVYIVLNDSVPSHLLFMCKDVRFYSSQDVKDVAVDCVIAVDSGAKSMFSDRLDLIGDAYLINIDHHATNTKYGDHQVLDYTAASAGEIVYNLLAEDKFDMSSEVATALFVAVSSDTGSFKYSNTTENTFLIASKLMSCGIDLNTINVELYQNMPYDNMRLKSEIFSRADFLYDGRLAISIMDEALLKELSIEKPNTEGVVEFMRDVQGVEAVVLIRWMGEDHYKISMRSKHETDVSRVALAFDGGGHKKAAGFRYKGSVIELKNQLVNLFKGAV